MRREDKIYQEKFGHIPDTQLERVEMILGKKISNVEFNKDIHRLAKKIKSIKFNTTNFTMWKIIKPSARPRATTRMGYVKMYVPHARENGDWFREFAKENDLPTINTPCILNMIIYEKTPSGFNIKEKVLAELGFLRPWRRTGDFDNYAKGIADAIQHGMLEDDYLVIESTQKLYYSIKPHAEVEIKYMKTHPDDIDGIFASRKKKEES